MLTQSFIPNEGLKHHQIPKCDQMTVSDVTTLAEMMQTALPAEGPLHSFNLMITLGQSKVTQQRIYTLFQLYLWKRLDVLWQFHKVFPGPPGKAIQIRVSGLSWST